MKGIPGLMIAAGLGIIGAICNWFYIAQQARDYEKVSFIAVKPGVQLKVGETFKLKHFQKVEIPKKHVGNLDKVAVVWSEVDAVSGTTAKRVYSGDEMIFHEDLREPGFKRPIEQLGKDEVAMAIPVDTSSFVASKVNPGDIISLAVPRSRLTMARDPDDPTNTSALPEGDGPTEVIGPFRILMIGNRTGSVNAFKATGSSARQENVITVSVKYKDGQFEPKAQRLFELRGLLKSQQFQVLLHPETKTVATSS